MILIPNWCECLLKMYGPREELLNFINKAKGVDEEGENTILSLNKFVPMPKELDGTTAPPDKVNPQLIKKYGADNWYDWNIRNWGCKWNINPDSIYSNVEGLFHVSVQGEVIKSKKVRMVYYSFDTPWSPPEKAIKTIGRMFPKLKFVLEYWEGGACFQGKLVIKNGRIIEDKCYDYHGKKGG